MKQPLKICPWDAQPGDRIVGLPDYEVVSVHYAGQYEINGIPLDSVAAQVYVVTLRLREATRLPGIVRETLDIPYPGDSPGIYVFRT